MTEIKATIPSLPGLTARTALGETASHKDIRIDLQNSPDGQALRGQDPLNRVAEIVEAHINEITGANRKVRVEMNEDADRMVYKVIDKETEEVIRQFPPEDLLKLIAYYRHVEGLGLDGSV